MAAGSILKPNTIFAQEDKLQNWAGNFTYSSTKIDFPKSVEEVRQLVSKYSQFKVLGTKHCFNTIADSRDQFISLKEMNQVVELNEKDHTVTVGGGMNYGQLCPLLEAKGYALHNLASLPHISVAGACATATHGSGLKNGNLSTAVSALEIINAQGDVINLSRIKDSEKFLAAVVNLGALGVVTKVTLDIQPSFAVRQDVYEGLPMEQLKKHFEEIEAGGYSVSLFTDWQSESINEVWVKNKVEAGKTFKTPSDYFGARAAIKNLHPIADLSAENCTEQMGAAGPWFQRLPHFKMGFTPSSGKELQSEYFVPRHLAVDAIQAVARLGKQIGPYLMITEIRTIDADNLWMSPCYHQPSVAIHFTWKQEIPAVNILLPIIEKALEPFNAKPHWGKLFTISPARLNLLYKRMNDFRDLVQSFDSKGKFRNEFLNKNIFSQL